ncbi:hypothetical protein FDT66_11920 [Polaribacter aestuariivivens]|uniref:Calx-beta domain-containing protein n=1 Tax=Polaribacter aestuariivivens TaxID=2304626 RepID=A0A5S3N174_9FLAO|nr:Calx-beta domain-containing protein [Polaribacter aestuariivivens]TMM29088.1 hypothetical protein FDT66_11920 [Polaribacter aestuariivivens]
MKFKFLLLTIVTFLFLSSCEDTENENTGTAIANFSVTELIEIENATSALNINIGLDNFNHAGGKVNIEISGGTYGTDFTTSTESASFELDIEAGSLVSVFTISPVDNELIEEDKTLTITMTSASGAIEVGDKTTISFTILENDNPLIAIAGFENAVASIDENASNATTINIPFNQESTNGGTISIAASGDAVYGTDYTVAGQTSGTFIVTVPAGATAASFDISAIDNTVFEADKMVTFTIEEVTGGLSIGPNKESVITIVNDDAAPNPVVDFNASNTTTIAENAGTLTINFDLSEATTTDATIELTASGTTTVGTDFTFDGSSTNPYSLTISAGATTASLNIPITDDTDFEGDETIILDITSVSGGLDAGVDQQQITITITDDDPDPSQLNYVETFESFDGSDTYLNDVLKYQNVLVTQTVDATKLIGLINNSGNFSDENDVSQASDNGLNLFYNTGSDSSLNGILDNVVITPLLTGFGDIDVSIDAAYAFRNQNSATVTFYWSQTYDGSGTFTESDWTVMGTETASDMNGEGFGNNSYKRENFSISTTANFYIAIRVNQTIDDSNYRTRWRFDNIKAVSK